MKIILNIEQSFLYDAHNGRFIKTDSHKGEWID